MNLTRLFTSPPPTDAFALDEQTLLFARLARRTNSVVRMEKAAFSVPWFQLGPVGVLQVDRQPLQEALGTALKRLDRRPSRAHLVVPNGWVRSVVVETGELPRRRDEAEDVVRWRLKKVLPCRPDEVRLDFMPSGTNGQVLVVLSLDRPLEVVEEVFAAAGVAIGRIEPSALALVALMPASTAPSLFVTVEERSLSLVLIAGGRLAVVRYKPLPTDLRRAEVFVLRELSRTLRHAREQEGMEGSLVMRVAATAPALAEAVRDWASGEENVEVLRMWVGEDLVPPVAGVPPLLAWSVYASVAVGEA